MQRDERVLIRLTKQERRELEAEAAREGRTISDTARRKLFPKPEPKQRKR